MEVRVQVCLPVPAAPTAPKRIREREKERGTPRKKNMKRNYTCGGSAALCDNGREKEGRKKETRSIITTCSATAEGPITDDVSRVGRTVGLAKF